MTAPPATGKWEACRGLGLAFGYNAEERDEDYLTPEQLIELHDDVRAHGGNLLINVGPMADASIPDIQQKALKALGKKLSA